jgi:hypothetical protein
MMKFQRSYNVTQRSPLAISFQPFCLLLYLLISAATVFGVPRQDAAEEWRARVKSDSLSVYSNASTKSKQVGVLLKGDVVIIKLEIVGEGATWCSIADAKTSSISGYVKDVDLDMGQPPALASWDLQPPPPTPEELEPVEESKSSSRPSPVAKSLINRGTISFKKNDVRAGLNRYFASRFGQSLPISAFGQTSFHGRLGFNHTNAFDIAVHPDSTEGREILSLLRAQGVPFIAFRSAVRGVASGPHIHVGHPSPRM